MKPKTTVRRTTVREKILNLLHKVGKPLDAKTIAKRGKLNYNTVRKELGILSRTMLVHNWFVSVNTKLVQYGLR